MTSPPECKGTDLAGELKTKLARLVQLRKARVNVMNIYFNGGDEEHQKQVDQVDVMKDNLMI